MCARLHFNIKICVPDFCSLYHMFVSMAILPCMFVMPSSESMSMSVLHLLVSQSGANSCLQFAEVIHPVSEMTRAICE